MKKLKDFELFLELKKEVSDSEVEKEVKKIISEMFAVGKGITFFGDQNGEPEYVEFEINSYDYKLDYEEDFFMEYSETVMKKRQYQVALKFKSKKNEGTEEKPKYKINFKIKITSASEVKYPKSKLGWSFEEKPIKTIDFIKKGHQDFDWDESKYILSIDKDDFESLASDQLRVIIRKEGGEKVRVK